MKILGTGSEIVWGAKEGKPIAQFQKGVFETKDEKLIQRLIQLGYKTDEEGMKTLSGMNKKKEQAIPPSTEKLMPESDMPDTHMPIRKPDETIQQYAARVKAWKKAQKEKADEQGDE